MKTKMLKKNVKNKKIKYKMMYIFFFFAVNRKHALLKLMCYKLITIKGAE